MYNNLQTIKFNDIYSTLIILQPCIKISYLTAEEMIKILNFPIKEYLPEISEKDIAQIKQNNGLFLITIRNEDLKLLSHKFHNEIDDKIFELLKTNTVIQFKELFKINKKFAAVTAGLGQYGKNQLVYNESFGFSHIIKVFLIYNPVINLPIRKPANYSYIDLCTNCNECIKNCPAQAIHSDDYPGWLDRDKCKNFFNFGNHDKFFTVKYGINAFLGNKFTDEEIQNIHNAEDFEKLFGFYCKESEVMGNDGKIYSLGFDYCRECQNQIPCRKIEYKYTKTWHKKVIIPKDYPDRD